MSDATKNDTKPVENVKQTITLYNGTTFSISDDIGNRIEASSTGPFSKASYERYIKSNDTFKKNITVTSNA
jgi:hypothetical protein